jgi:hypothetical protein
MEAFSQIFGPLAGLPAMAVLLVAALTLFLTSDWRLSLAALLAEYIGLGLALLRFVQPQFAAAKILTGALAVAILYLSARNIQEARRPTEVESSESRFLGLPLAWAGGPLGLPLRLLAVLLVSLALVRLFEDYRLPLVPVDVAFVTAWLASLGVMGLVLGGDLLRIAPALLTILVGFDLVYTGLESNLAVAGLFAALNLFAALAFSYLAMVQGVAPDSARGRAPDGARGRAQAGQGAEEEAEP